MQKIKVILSPFVVLLFVYNVYKSVWLSWLPHEISMQNAGEPWLEMRNNIHIILTIIITMTHIQGFSTGDFMEIR